MLPGNCRWAEIDEEDTQRFLLLLKGLGCLGFTNDSRPSKGFEVGFEVMRQLEEMR